MNVKKILVTSLVSLVVTACGGGSDNSNPPVAGSDPVNVVEPTVAGDGLVNTAEPVAAGTGELKNNAISSIGGRFDGSLTAVGTALNDNSDFGSTVNDVATGGSDQMVENLPTDLGIQQDVENWMSVSLGTDENSDSTTSRDGNIITVDPDEAELCREEGIFDQSSADDFANCTAFFKDVTVRLVATTEEEGLVTYLYQQQPVISLGYAPNSESVELDFGGIKAMLDGIAVIEPNEFQGELPSVMSGSIKVSATETNQIQGQEAGSVSFDIAKPIQLVSSNDEGETSLSMGSGTLMSISADAGTGQGNLSFDLGAISAAAPTDSGLGQMNLAGFTGEADVNPNDGVLVVRNFGLSKGPFSFSVNNEEVIRATLGAFGFQVTEGSDLEPGELIIDGNMDLSIIAKQFADNEMGDNLVAMTLDMMAPNGTIFSVAGNGATQVGGAGPFTISLGQTPAQGTPTLETVIVNSGQCFTELFDDSVPPPSVAQCN